MERGREQDHAAFNAWKYRHYFEFDSVKSDKNISVRCTLCVGRKLLSTAKNSTSNLSKHLASRHRNVKLIEKPPDPPTDMTAAATTSNSTGQTSDGPSPAKQTESFRRIVEKIPTKSGVKLPQRKSFAGHLEREYDIMDANLKATLGEVDFVSTTADIWTVEEVSRRKLMVPTSTRWNSLYEAISRIITIPLNELNPLCVKLGIKCLNEREYQFLKEYCTVMKPLTVALDILQGDECTYGALLPTLTSLIKINIFLVISYCILQAIKTPSPAEMDFFDFENQPTESFSAEKEVTDYLRSGYELEILNQFPNLKKMYMKYNTPTPSSAPVERLFSLGGLVLSPKRNRLSDRRFEKLLLMRYNHCFTPKENKKT
ncbi:Phosphoheptose isomerase [Dissostichus eleginoides]|uniref:Phosphoheptose isomerase n=1 Tax=Dissostichus eleginoides TaxID=100907 RepID=A0AAD9BZ76_DISEL|nr:Phosphoheptose isomerase [Dissostichus eleginoides]